MGQLQMRPNPMTNPKQGHYSFCDYITGVKKPRKIQVAVRSTWDLSQMGTFALIAR